MRADTGHPIVAVADGIVEWVRAVDPGKGYGIAARVKHSDRFKTTYGHLQSASVTVGQPVKAGDLIGPADSTGDSTGPHLHLTLYDFVNGLDGYIEPKVVDPLPYLEGIQ